MYDLLEDRDEWARCWSWSICRHWRSNIRSTSHHKHTICSSPRLATSHYCQQLTLSVCPSDRMSVTLLQIASYFCFSMESSHFWPSVLHVALYKSVFFDFWFRPPNAQNLLPKICTKLPISRLVWQIDRRCLGLTGGYRGWPIQWNHGKCCGPISVNCHGNKI